MKFATQSATMDEKGNFFNKTIWYTTKTYDKFKIYCNKKH